MTSLSKHFHLSEFTRSDIASRRGIQNVPDAETIEHLKETAALLEQVRELLGCPIQITSGYRSLKLNSAIGSKPTSDHVQGYAADFVAPGYGSPREVCHAIMDSTIDYGQLICEFDAWTHISTPHKVSRVNLTIDAQGTRNGINA